ncbi:hypothetical protein Dvina_17590 [Dactylosporangium vinaceum]|uniref:Uncharacterized protein n=1 Tax=Dactylosporangium vinaceum TaxID=53362 RepID=A0ABV5M3C9_9ACTN|nr:hypothetical protein [Dactylosporangium vinaceum]UAB99714.1 hypothetical protein Dvina_17590 [Dactylosporangium vinaceum]
MAIRLVRSPVRGNVLAGDLHLTGDLAAVEKFLHSFALPEAAPSGATDRHSAEYIQE